MYRATSATQDVARDYELLTEVLAEQIASMPDSHEIARSAGRSWGQRTAMSDGALKVEEIHGHVARLGFDPTGPEADGTVVLRSCPILAAARLHPDVVCTVHLGFVQSLLERAGADSEDVELLPMAHETGCILRVGALASPASDEAATIERPENRPAGGVEDSVA